MARLKAGLYFVLAIALQAAPAAAQIGGRPFELSGGAGYFAPDARAHTQSGPAYTSGLGWRTMPSLSLELHGTWAPSKADTAPQQKHNFSLMGGDLRWNLRPAYDRVVPFLLVGAGYATSHTGGTPVPNYLARGAADLGLGLLVNLGNPRAYLRLQARDVMFRERAQAEFSNHFAVTAGLQLALGGKHKDQDLDGVTDWYDRCPNTPIGARVDARGCPIDSDGDGVFDGIDKCPSTPKGCTVDKLGCPADADSDGVCDGVDQCPNTPRGATVDARGCPSDPDGDGVYDGIDKCPNTPKGCTVDAFGCPSDADGDGVCDGLDQCPNTPAGLKVDDHGCPIEISEKEVELLDTGSIRLQNINFDSGKASLKPESFAVIDTVARILVQYPTLKIEIGGHTDNRGTKAKNDTLSQMRADSVLAYIRKQFPGLDASQYSSKGYGFARPIAPNTTALGRAKNRRVEFRVLNTSELRIEREKRRFLMKQEAAPPATTPAVPAPSDTTKTGAAPRDSTKATPAPADSTKK